MMVFFYTSVHIYLISIELHTTFNVEWSWQQDGFDTQVWPITIINKYVRVLVFGLL